MKAQFNKSGATLDLDVREYEFFFMTLSLASRHPYQ